MDYDDNDAPSNNFQLAGEGGSKSSSVLRPYAFPRFDFDDSLPGQLRFDSLVETEVFLGIQSQEDNQWIEDYSRGNNVIEFSSSATDSCSISRRNNVWSEATSSESVEMLLKSVGQDQIGHSDSVIDNSSTTFNELDRLAKQMEANRDKESRNSGYSKISEDTTLPSNELLGNPKDHVERDLADIQGTSLPEVSFTSAHGDPSLSVPSVSEDKFVASGTEETLHVEGECADRSGKETGCFNDESMYCMTGTESCNVSGPQDIDTSLGNLNSSESPKEIRDSSQEDARALTDGVSDGMEEDQHISNEAKEGSQVSEKHAVEDASLSVGSRFCHASTVDKSNADETISNLCMESGGISLGESEHQLLEGTVKDALCTAESQQEDEKVNVLLTSGSVIDANKDGELIAVDKEQLDCKISSLSEGLDSPIESTRDSVKQVADGLSEKLGKSIYKEDSEVTGSISKSSFDARDLIENSTDKIDEAKSVEDFRDALTIDAKEPKFQSGCEEVPVIKEDVSVAKEVHIEVSGDSMNLSSPSSVAGTEQRVMGSSYVVETIAHGEIMLDQMQAETAAEKGSETDSLPGEKKSEVAALDKEDTVTEPSATVVCESDFAPKISTDYSLVKEKSTPAVLEIEFETAVSGLSEDHPEGSRALLGQHEDTLNKIESGSAKIAKNQEDESVLHVVEKESLLPTDSMEIVCGSPTIINSGDPVQDEEFKQQKVRASAVAEEVTETQQCASKGPKVKDTSEDDNSFTFKVNSLPEAAEREKDASWTPFSVAEKYKSPKVVEAPRTPNMEKIDARSPPENPGPSPVALTTGAEKMHAKVVHETSGRSRKVSEGDLVGGTSKSASGRKGRRASGKGIDKEGSLKLNSQKDTTPTKSARKGDKSPSVLLSSSGSTLPAFNPSGSPPTPSFQQPFTDMQQVQLRAQIFVYGSLIQGTAPEEACMVSAFGSSDGGRKVWESAWRAAVERVHSRKSHSGVETPVHSAAVRSPDLVGKQGSQQSKVLPAPATRVGSKGLPAPMLNPMITPSSPLWNVSTPHDSSQSSGIQRSTVVEYQPAISPLHPFQTPPVRSFIGHTAWPSQPPFPPSPWAAQTAVSNAGARFSTTPITEPVKLIPVKDSSLPPLSGMQNVSTSPIVITGDPNLVFAGVSSSLPGQTLGVSSSQLPSTDLKPRRRKKSQASADVGQSPPTSQTESALASPMAIPTPSLVAVTTSASQIPNAFSTVAPMCSIATVTSSPQPKVGDLNAGKGDTCADDTLRNVSEAKLQAEVAASLAAAALNHSQCVWNDLAKQKDSGGIPEVDAKLSSAAVAIAAAASVAKAAAAAARVASNAALQAKLMAEEALIGSRTLPQGGIISSDVLSTRNIDDNCCHPGSIILAAREAAKRRIEAATAAAKQAENLDAIVRAAELAAEAVSQAGHIVAMGEPLPLKELIDAGPAGYWKVPQTSLELAVQLGDKNDEQRDASVQEKEGGPSAGVNDASSDKKTSSREKLIDSCHVSIAADDIPQSVNSAKNDQDILKKQNDTNIDESSGIVHVLEPNVGAELVPQEPEELEHGSSIVKGSLVEVYKQGDGLKPAWFLATVLAVEDGKAFVCYSSLLSDGSNNLKEWVALDGLVGQAPRIRTAPAASSHSQGTRKRRRMATGDYAWNVRDRVDVQFQDSWWEGVVTEKNEKDESTLTVYFPARGETSAVRSWQLRPSRIWSDGEWVELPRVRAQDRSTEDDIPNEKRQKLGSPLMVSKGKDKLSEISETHAERPEGSKLLALSSKDKLFNVGKNTNSESKPGGRRTARTGLQKDGSKVVFGVPKPGKKRKFMEVSKHYPANSNIPPDRSNKHEANDPAKFTKYLVPQSTGSRGWKSFSKVDSKEKHTAPRAASSHKPSTTARRTLPRREKTSKSESAKHEENFTDSSADINDPELHDDNVSDRLRLIDQESSGPEEAKEGPLSSLFPSQLEKLSSSSSARFERLYKGKLGPSGGKLTKIEEEVPNGKTGKAASEAAEPRRSNRRIQPTHRLLEGLQSSLIIPKMSSVSHDRNHRTQGRSTTGKGK